MPYDPTRPMNDTVVDADELRAQFHGLKELVDAVPAGPQGAPGPKGDKGDRGEAGVAGATGEAGPPLASAVVDAVTTLDPGLPATVTSSFDGTEVHLRFALPRGETGPAGADGSNGSDGPAGPTGAAGNDGAPGATGAQGPPFASAAVDAVTTLNPGESATVTTGFDGSTVHFNFGIPRGANGADGAPGEVSAGQLAAAVAGTSSNTNAVATLDTVFSDPPTIADLEAVRAKLNELILAQRR